MLHKALCVRNLFYLYCTIVIFKNNLLLCFNEAKYGYIKNMSHFSKEHKRDFIEPIPFLSIIVPSIFTTVYIFLEGFPSNIT